MARALARRCAHAFPAPDQARGLHYLEQDRLTIEPRIEGLHAEVQGSRREPYSVWLDWARPGTVGVFCDCPRFGELGRCKHLWATILAADRAGLTEGLARGEAVEVVAMEPPFLLGDAPASAARAAESPWRQALRSLRRAPPERGPWQTRAAGAPPPEVYYVLDGASRRVEGGVHISFFQRRQRRDGQPGVMRKLAVSDPDLPGLAQIDRELLELLRALPEPPPPGGWWRSRAPWETVAGAVVPAALFGALLPRLAASGRLLLSTERTASPPLERVLSWDDGPAWKLELAVTSSGEGPARLEGTLYRTGERVPLALPELVLADGLVVLGGRLARFEGRDHGPWIALLRADGGIEIPAAELAEAVVGLHELPHLPPLHLPREVELEVCHEAPQPRLQLGPPQRQAWPAGLRARVSFRYGGGDVTPDDPRTAVAHGTRLWVRDAAAEEAALELLAALRLEAAPAMEPAHLLVPEREMIRVAEALLEAGWLVEAQGVPLARGGATRLTVVSGIDWFELDGDLDFGGEAVPLPTLLAAARRGQRLVRLANGGLGLLPADWLARHGSLAQLAQGETASGLRFGAAQAWLLDALLAELPGVDVDPDFARLRDKLRGFAGFTSRPEPRGFRGTLRPYQREGLGWLLGLGELGMGGCLADDMGLGKTVQVLALLQQRRVRPAPRGDKRPSLVVAPRTLIFNWIREAQRFAPRLRVLDYSGPARRSLDGSFDGHDLVMTTYDTLRRDIARLRQVRFDVAVLDEAQAIKNPHSQRAKACRLIRADQRLALTGTPVENHLGDLWSIFEFLNPGMLGRLASPRQANETSPADGELIARLTRALGPFILRRTKQQVIHDLPAKTEQILDCELGPRERRLYEELRNHYRAELAGRLEQKGLARSKIHVLEALLRLRQAACHPGLVDPERAGEPSAKLEVLLEQLEGVLDEGHKALVYSQFTSLLKIVRARLEGTGVVFEYLDGRTRDRQARVDRFQTDPQCRVFLISLKAGGVGLNLTAAGYVFILDPWWNPAAEAQAVDRTHRIGQTQPVFAYRLIGRDTVEEKIVLLQQRKRELADAVITSDESLLRRLTAEDLEVLLG